MLQRKTARAAMGRGKFKKTAVPDNHTRLRASACAVHDNVSSTPKRSEFLRAKTAAHINCAE
jgi:hypothetical protein